MAASIDLDGRNVAGGHRAPLPAPPPRLHAARGRVGLALGAAAVAMTALAVAAVVGGAVDASVLSEPGMVSRWALLASRTVYDITAMATIGVLLLAVVLLPAPGGLSAESQRLVRVAGRWSAGWAAAGAISVPLVLSDVAGLPVWEVLAPDVLPLAADLPQTRALLSSVWLAALVAVGSRHCRSHAVGWLLLVTGFGALLPLLLTGHTGHGDDHVVAVVGLTTHVAAASVWVGGLLAVGVHVRTAGVLASVLPRYSRVALGSFALVALSGLAMAWVALTEPGELFTTRYGQLLLAKTTALCVLGALGHRHRRRTIPAVAASRPRAFLRLAAVELAVMAATVGLAVGLSRTSPPDVGDHAAAAVSVQTTAQALQDAEPLVG